MKVTNSEKTICIEDTKIIFRHFSGEKDQFHAQDDRDFCIPLDPSTLENFDEVVAALKAEGWNIKEKDYGDHSSTWINKIKVSYKIRPPMIKIVMNGANGPVYKDIGPENVATLDYADIESVDVMIDKHFYGDNYEKCNGYLRSMYVKLVEDPLAMKYATAQ